MQFGALGRRRGASSNVAFARDPSSELGLVDAALAFDQKRVGNPEAAKLESFPLFDWLRFVLASIVVLVHEGIVFPGPINGGLAVSVFFALSGWLIGGIVLRTDRQDLPRFFFNRCTRIWIPYLATFAAIYGLAAMRDGIDLNWFKYAYYDLTFTHFTFTSFPRASHELPLGGTGNHFWSISVEEQFYLLAPLLMFVRPIGKELATWLLVAACLLFLGSVFAPIALGVSAACTQQRFGDWQCSKWGRMLTICATVVTFALLWRWPGPQIESLFCVAMVVALAQPGKRNPVGLFFGAISYPVYLNHWMGGFAVNFTAKQIIVPSLIHKVATYFVGLLAGVASWILIDRRIMASRTRWYTPRLGRIATITAYSLLLAGFIGGTVIKIMGG